MPGVRNIIGGTFEDIGESMVKPVSDEVGKAIEQGVKSVVSGNPQQTPQPDEKSAMVEARRKVQYWQNLESGQRKVREDQKNQEAQKTQEIQEKKEIKQFEIVEKKQQNIAVQQAKTKTETRGGVGG